MSIVSRSMLVGIVAFALAGCDGGGAITPELLQQIPESGPGKPVTLAEYEKVLGGSRDGDSLTSDKFQAQIDQFRQQAKGGRLRYWGSESSTMVLVAVQGDSVIGRMIFGAGKKRTEAEIAEMDAKRNADEAKRMKEWDDREARAIVDKPLRELYRLLPHHSFFEKETYLGKEAFLEKLKPGFDDELIDAIKKNAVVGMWGKPKASAVVGYLTKDQSDGVLVAAADKGVEVWTAKKLADALKVMGTTRTNRN